MVGAPSSDILNAFSKERALDLIRVDADYASDRALKCSKIFIFNSRMIFLTKRFRPSSDYVPERSAKAGPGSDPRWTAVLRNAIKLLQLRDLIRGRTRNS